MAKRVAKTVKPWTDFSSADATAANFPALKHFFPCEDGAGTYGLRDIVGGVVYASNGWEEIDSYSVRPSHTSNVTYHNLALSSGAWNISLTKVTLIFMCGKFDGLFSFGIGDSVSTQEISFTNTAFLLALNRSGNTATLGVGATVGNTLPTITGGYYDPAGNGYGIYTDTSGVYTASVATDVSAIAPMPTLPAIGSIGGKTELQALYGLAVFQFNTIPTDLAKAVEWMRAEWARGRKAIYPGWVGLS